ncbi:MAG: FAD-dependent oxidoreductase, partial [Bacteroidota bacterium]
RSGANTILVTPISWLGGMLTAAGVSATDGNHKLPAGLWGAFRDSLRRHYGGADSLFTGWVSNTMFEPKVGDHYWKQIAANEKQLRILYDTNWEQISREGDTWKTIVSGENKTLQIKAKILIDGTDLGDVAAAAGAGFDIGMDARADSDESMAPENANDIIQDLTYAAILKDYGPGANKTITKPAGYDRRQFLCACQKHCNDDTAQPHPCLTMLNYGKLPNDKYMINWPIKGNDYYTNIIEKDEQGRRADLAKAKNKTLQFIYYIQTELGYPHLGLAEDEFPTDDHLPLMVYHREGRRIHGLSRLNVNHVLKPYDYTLYRTGVAVGDYPIDHHHYERPDAPEIDFPPVPSFAIPAGAMLPEKVDHLIVADKAISVSNIVNGSSRLQPVIVQIGQVAGLVAAIAVTQQQAPRELDLRQIQNELLKADGYLLPFIDVDPGHPHFESVQRIGATGLLRGKGIPFKWANQTWFYPDTSINVNTLLENSADYFLTVELKVKKEEILTIGSAIAIIDAWSNRSKADSWQSTVQAKWSSDWSLNNYELSRPIKKYELAVLLDKTINPFARSVDLSGKLLSNQDQ